MEESETEKKEKEVERKVKEGNERVQGTRRKGWRIEELRKSEAKKNSGSRSRRAEMGGGGGRRNLPASLVRAFLHPSCPSFGCFHGRHLVGSFTPGRRAACE